MLISAKQTHVFRKGAPFLRILRKRRTFPKGRVCRFSQESTKFPRKTHTFTKCSRKTHMFNDKRTFSENGCHVCDFCEKDARFPRVEFVYISQEFTKFQQKTHIFRKICNCCEFCEKDVRFPRVEFVDFPNNSLNFNEKDINSHVIQFVGRLSLRLR